MTLSYVRPIGPSEVGEIAAIRDDIYRNRWITFGYYDISQRMRAFVGDDNASWCTFSTWSSRTVGDNLRIDEVHPAGEQWLRSNNVRLPPLRWLVRQLGFWLRRRKGAAMPHVLALGNRLVFNEIGLAYTRFLEAFETATTYDRAAWAHFERTIEPLPATPLFKEGDVAQLRNGLACYYRARWAPDPKTKAELVLRGNLLLGVYEQTRLQPLAEAALSPFSHRLLRIEQGRRDRLTGVVAPNEVTLARREKPWALRHRSPWRRWVARRWASLLTRRVMLLDLPAGGDKRELLRMGEGLPEPGPGAPLYPAPLDVLADAATDELFRLHDRSGGTARGCRVRNWATFDDRMNYIVNLFRARQCRRALYDPLPGLDRRAVQLVVGPAELDRLRTLGDPEADAVVEQFCEETGRDPRQFLDELVRRVDPATAVEGTTGGALIAYRGANPDLPPWADEDLLRKGQAFFRRFSLEIASALFSASLPMSYTAADGARVLTTTGDLVKRPHRRIAETGQMLLDVMAAEPSDQESRPLAPHTAAYRAARGVRLFHAAVRHWLTTDPKVRWNSQERGVPINQEDLLGTLLVFTVWVLESLEKLGVRYKESDRKAYVHLWLVVGSLMGIDYEHLYTDGTLPVDRDPLTYGEMKLLADEILLRSAERSAEGRELMAALLQVSQKSMPRGLRGLPPALVRRLIGPDYSDMLGVPRAGRSRFILDVMRPVAWLASISREVDGLGRLAGWANKRLYTAFITEGQGERPQWRGIAVLETWKLPRAVLATASSAAGGGQQGARAPLQESGAVGVGDAPGGVEERIDITTPPIDLDQEGRPLEVGLGEEERSPRTLVGGDSGAEQAFGPGDVTGGGGEHAEEVGPDGLGHGRAGEDAGEGGEGLP